MCRKRRGREYENYEYTVLQLEGHANSTLWSREKQAEVLSTGSMTTMTRGDSQDTLTFFIQTDTGNSTPYDVTASICEGE